MDDDESQRERGESGIELPTTEELVGNAHANRVGEPSPDAQRLLENLPVLLRAVCDYILSGEADVISVAQSLASVIDVIEHAEEPPSAPASQWH
jgi:hypothetical protein